MSQLTDRVLGERGSLKRKSSTGVIWLSAGNVLRGAVGIVLSSKLARVLGPGPVGDFALIVNVLGVAGLLADAGITSALIQRKHYTAEDVRSSHTYTMVQSTSVALVLVAGAVPISILLRQPALVWPLIICALSLPINSLGNTSGALLQRDMRHRHNQWCYFAAFLLGQGGIALPLALHGWGIWAFVSGYAAQALISSIFQWALIRHSLRPHWKRDRATNVFTWSILLQNMSNWCLSNIDQYIVARNAGAVLLGAYNRGRWIIETPLNFIIPSIQSIMVAATARTQHDIQKVRGILLRGIALSVAVTLPVALIVACFPTQIVMLLLGKAFLPAATLLPVFAVERMFMAVLSPIGPVLTGFGRPEFEAKLSWAVVPVALITLPLSARYGLLWIAVNLAFITFLRMASHLVVAWMFFWRGKYNSVDGSREL